MKNKDHDVVVSEYLCNVPEGWEVIWKHESKKYICETKRVYKRAL